MASPVFDLVLLFQASLVLHFYFINGISPSSLSNHAGEKRKYRCLPAFSVFLFTINLTCHRFFTVRWIYLTSSQECQHQPAMLTCPSSPNRSQVLVGYSLGPLPLCVPLHYFQGRELDLTNLSSGTGVSKLSSEPIVGALYVSLL